MIAGSVGVVLGAVIFFSHSNILSRTLTVSWSYDYSAQPPCTDKRPNDCIQGFEILDYTDPEKPKLLRSVANPKNSSGKVNGITDEFSYGPPFGLRTIVVVTVARDASGVRRTSNPFAAWKRVEILPKVLGQGTRSRMSQNKGAAIGDST